MNEIIVIGTNPPCPRCGLLTSVLKEKITELNINANVRHLCYTDVEAKSFAKKIGLETGTAKDVSKKLGIPINIEGMQELIIDNSSEENFEYKKYNQNNWSSELDKFLREFEKKAIRAKILMTPILVINNQIIHSGSVPRLSYIENLLRNLK